MKVSFIVPAYNSEKTISQCIESILLQNVEKEVIVVDNGSVDKTAEIVKRFPVRYLFEQKRGPAAAKNRGLKEVNKKSEYIAFIDSDVILPNNWAKKAIYLLEKYPEVVGVGGPGKSIIKNSISQVFDYLLFGRMSQQKEKIVKTLPTMNLMYKYKYIENMFFDERLIAAAAEDTDFNFRLIKKGYKLLYSDELWVYHFNPTTLLEVIKKWFNYGKYYPLPYFWNKRTNDIGLWGRILYLPFIFFIFFLGVYNKNFTLFYFLLLIIPFFYFCLGIKAGIRNIYKIFMFSFVHSIKQVSQIIGMWYGIISRMLR